MPTRIKASEISAARIRIAALKPQERAALRKAAFGESIQGDVRIDLLKARSKVKTSLPIEALGALGLLNGDAT